MSKLHTYDLASVGLMIEGKRVDMMIADDIDAFPPMEGTFSVERTEPAITLDALASTVRALEARQMVDDISALIHDHVKNTYISGHFKIPVYVRPPPIGWTTVTIGPGRDKDHDVSDLLDAVQDMAYRINGKGRGKGKRRRFAGCEVELRGTRQLLDVDVTWRGGAPQGKTPKYLPVCAFGFAPGRDWYAGFEFSQNGYRVAFAITCTWHLKEGFHSYFISRAFSVSVAEYELYTYDNKQFQNQSKITSNVDEAWTWLLETWDNFKTRMEELKR